MTSHITVIVTGSCDLKKDIKRLGTNIIIQHSNSMLTL